MKVISYFCCIVLTLSFGDNAQSQCSVNRQIGHVDCRKRNLTSVPTDLPPETRFLDLSGNQIHQVDSSSFKHVPLVIEIYLANNSLTTITYATFTNLENLKVLDVSYNRLSHFNIDVPVSVEILYLNYNPLFTGQLFQQRLIYIKFLSLAGTNITQPSIFSSFLPALQYLDLRDIPSLTLSVNELKKLRHLRTLYVSPRMFSGRNRIQICREFIKAAREIKVEVKAFSCFTQENFEMKARTFERIYEVDEVSVSDHPDNVLNIEVKNLTLNGLQTLVSNGVINFMKSILVEKDQKEKLSIYKIKEPLNLEDFQSEGGQMALTSVYMTGFPALKPVNPVKMEFGSADATELKRFRVLYKTTDLRRDLVISGNYRMYSDAGNFTCKFASTNYESVRQMLRRYDFLTFATNIKEVLEFEKLNCDFSTHEQLGHLQQMVLSALSKTWLDSVVNVANTASLEPAIRNMSHAFIEMYRNRVLSKVIGASLDYLKNINVDSFDVTPSLFAPTNESNIEFITQNQYNVKINNLFNYTNNEIAYSVDTTTSPDMMRILGKYKVIYDPTNPSTITISAKDNPNDMMRVFISSIEFDVHFEVRTINEVNRFNIGLVNAMVVETTSDQRNILYMMFKKYLGIELSKELKRSLTYLTSKVDFYSLNVL